MTTAQIQTQSQVQAISLFSGCGGDTLGLERAGWKVVAFSECKLPAVQTHLANFPESSALTEPNKQIGDITKLPDSLFTPYKGKVDLVFAGFPCQGFSTAGKKVVTDPRNQLFRQFVRVAKVVEPTFVIGENVTGLLTMKSGPKPEDPLMLEVIREAFAEIGYTLTHHVLEAVEFGVPQSRKRLLLVGWRQDRVPQFSPASFWPSVLAWGASRTMPKLESFVRPTLEGALQLIPGAIPPNFELVSILIPQDMEVTGTPHPYVKLKANAVDAVYGEKTYDRLLSCRKRDSPIHSEVLDLKNPCKTIICTYDHQPRLLVGLRKPDGTSYVRTLLPEELKQIQGFPANFQLCGNQKEQIVQVGNAVPPALVEGIAIQLLGFLVKPAQQEQPKKKVRLVRGKSSPT
jgi:DNA (cytosine-5)-methyltransferase 1